MSPRLTAIGARGARGQSLTPGGGSLQVHNQHRGPAMYALIFLLACTSSDAPADSGAVADTAPAEPTFHDWPWSPTEETWPGLPYSGQQFAGERACLYFDSETGEVYIWTVHIDEHEITGEGVTNGVTWEFSGENYRVISEYEPSDGSILPGGYWDVIRDGDTWSIHVYTDEAMTEINSEGTSRMDYEACSDVFWLRAEWVPEGVGADG